MLIDIEPFLVACKGSQELGEELDLPSPVRSVGSTSRGQEGVDEFLLLNKRLR